MLLFFFTFFVTLLLDCLCEFFYAAVVARSPL